MKSILKASLLGILLALSSCAHHRHGDHKSEQCGMHKSKENCKECGKSGQCDMKSDAAASDTKK